MNNYNEQIVRIVLSHYFCNLDEEADNNYIRYLEDFKDAIDQDEDIGWNELPNYLIWEPFADTSPTFVLENMLSLYTDIVNLVLKNTYDHFKYLEKVFKNEQKEKSKLKLSEFILNDDEVLENVCDITLDEISDLLALADYEQIDFSPNKSEVMYDYENLDGKQLTAEFNFYTLTWNFYK